MLFALGLNSRRFRCIVFLVKLLKADFQLVPAHHFVHHLSNDIVNVLVVWEEIPRSGLGQNEV